MDDPHSPDTDITQSWSGFDLSGEAGPDDDESLPADEGTHEAQRRGRRHGPITRDDLLNDLRSTIDKLEQDETAIGDLKILSRSLRELRYAFKIFSHYRLTKKVTVFGSARTPSEAPAYQHALNFGRLFADAGWMVVTGAGGGIMEGAHVGAGRDMAMGVNIMLPFEQRANPVIEGDRKLINLRYFFTRKLLFVKEVHAIALFAGGFGTQDEAFETLTLVQTGKRDMMPIVFIDEPGGSYWKEWQKFVERQFLEAGLISPEDMSLFLVTDDLDEAYNEIMNFYRVYDSMRYIRDRLVLRLRAEPSDEYVEQLTDDFKDLLARGRIEKSATHEFESDETHISHLPRLRMRFDRRHIGRLRQLIDRLNTDLEPDPRFG
ncbi:cytochrome D ubiquinol oxidase subunit II [bacterium]|nr:cytochrome D ubiquinol oxidase subunit II [bacterium]